MMRTEDFFVEDQELSRVLTPALLCFPEIVEENIRRMVQIAGDPKRLWVHIKTTKSPPILRRLRAAGITHFKCATFAEAEMAGACGAENVLWTYPLVGPNIPLLLTLQRRFPGTRWLALADHADPIREMGRAARQAGTFISLLIDVDVGMHRTGIAPEKLADMCALAGETQGLCLAGVHAYDGHIHAADPLERQALVDAEHAALDPIVEDLRSRGLPLNEVVWGGTPTFPCHSAYAQASLSPGTCVLHDAGYAGAFPNLPFRPAAAVLTRVISHPAPDSFTLDLGYKGLAADAAPPRARLIGYEGAETLFQSEEHWTMRLPQGTPLPAVGQAIFAIPSHICPMVHLYPCYLAVQEGRVREEWPIPARNRRVAMEQEMC